MSIRDFFSHSVLRQSALEYLKNKADFPSLQNKYKKAFRGVLLPRDRLLSSKKNNTRYKGPLNTSGLESSTNLNNEARLLVSDGFNSLPCSFSEECILDFEDTYPTCIKIHEVTNMLVCILDFTILLHTNFEDPANIVDHGFFVQGGAARGGNNNQFTKKI